jgi:hypothetical protein
MWVAALFLSLVAGWFLVRLLAPAPAGGPRWASLLRDAALAALFGPGLGSVLFFFGLCAGVAGRLSVWSSLTVAAVLAGAAWWRIGESRVVEAAPWPRWRWNWALLVAFGLGLALFLGDFQAASDANPLGEWDAAGIWNLRARFLAGGEATWRAAISPANPHPGYPLLLSSFLALQWMAGGGGFPAAVPIVASLLFALALLGLLVGGVAVGRRSTGLGLLAGLLLMGSEVFAAQAASQYSDLVLGLAVLATLVLVEEAGAAGLSPPRSGLLAAAGLAIGLAPWTKNEGIPFAVAALAVCGWRFRRAAMWTAAGALPGVAASVLLKAMAEGRESVLPASAAEALGKMAEFSRWGQVLGGFAKGVWEAGPGWGHPVLLCAVLWAVLRLVPSEERRAARLWPAIPVAAMLAAEFGLLLVSTADLAWHLSTSVSRLLAQVWPGLIWLLISSLRAPEESDAGSEPKAIPASTSSRRARAARSGKGI